MNKESEATNPTGPSAEELAELQAIYDEGRFLTAFEASKRFGPLGAWMGTGPRLLASRLANHLGSREQSRRIFLRSWRRDRTDWRSRYHFIWTVLDYRGPLEALHRLEEFGAIPRDDLRTYADFCSLRGKLASMLRDFTTADRWFALALDCGVELPWTLAEQSERLEREDRYDEALAVCRRGLEKRPHHWALAASASRLLQITGEDQQALAVLNEALKVSESGYLVSQLYALRVELGQHAEALATLDLVQKHNPLADADHGRWLNGQRATCLHLLGRRAEAAEMARQAGDDAFWKSFAERLASDAPLKRLELPVGFVRQHHVTCVPATLSTLTRYWGKPADHLEIAEAICYDGTSSHNERRWAESNGWAAREFKVTIPAARQLLDLGIPFALTTVAPGSGHEQAVVGYDEFRESLLIRDPFFRNRWEAPSEGVLKQQAASGPRGMVLLPPEKAALLEGVELPDAAVYDVHHDLLLAVDAHDRPRAFAALARMQREFPEHRLTFQAARALAIYDYNPAKILEAVERLLGLFPDDVNFQMSRLACLRDLARRTDRLEILQKAAAAKDAHPTLLLELARELSADAREHATVVRLLDRASRSRPVDAWAFSLRADILWTRGDRVRATEIYRFAACLNPHVEGHAQTYFRAARALGRTDEALEFLRRRFEEVSKVSAFPGRTLAWALNELNRSGEALAVLRKLLELRPSDGPLKLHVAEELRSHGDGAGAKALLDEARPLVSANDWHRAVAWAARRDGLREEALAHWREVLSTEPLAMDAHREATLLLAESAGIEPALQALRASVERCPNYLPLHQLLAEWAQQESHAAVEAACRGLLAVHDADAWARRELALALLKDNRFDEALAEANLACELEPSSSSSFGIRGEVLFRAGRIAEAREDFRRALLLSVDNVHAMRLLVDCGRDALQRRDAILFIQDELIRQTTFGTGLMNFADVARPFVSPEGLLELLRRAHSARPDLWEAWTALAEQLAASGKSEEALSYVDEATKRFPLIPRVWLQLGLVHRARLDREKEAEAFEKIRELSPGWGAGMRELAGALEALGKHDPARVVLEHAIQRAPLDAYNHGCLADLLHKAGRNEEALARLKKALELEPGYDWGWMQLRQWGEQVNDPELPSRMAEEVARQRPGEARSWFLVARLLSGPEQFHRRIEALDKAIERSGRFVDAWDLKIVLLAQAGRWEEAVAACSPAAFGDAIPSSLAARAAWIRALRGNTPAAVDAMRLVLARDPGLVWGWRMLADWLAELDRTSEALDVVQTLKRLQPFDAVPLGFSADLNLKMDRRKEAIEDLKAAFRLNPDYLWAGETLFLQQLQDSDWDGALSTLNRLRPALREPALRLREVQLALAMENFREAMARLTDLCRCRESDEHSFDAVLDVLRRGQAAADAEKTVAALLQEPEINPATGALWVNLRGALGNSSNLRVIDSLPAGSPLERSAVVGQLDLFGEFFQKSARSGLDFASISLRMRWSRFRRKRAAMLRADTLLWGKVTYVLMCRDDYRGLVSWAADWRERTAAEPWMLFNLALSLLSLNRLAEAREVIAHTLASPKRDSWSTRFELWNAVMALADGDRDPAETLIASMTRAQLGEWDSSLLALLLATVPPLRPDAGPNAYGRVEENQVAEFLRLNGSNRGLMSAYKAIMKRVAQRTGRWTLGLGASWDALVRRRYW